MTTATLADYIDAHEQLFAHYDHLCAGLTDDQMAMQSLCPDWDVRGVVTHTIGVESVLDGWTPSTDTPPPFDRFGPYLGEVAALDRDAFAARMGEITGSRLAHLRSLDPAAVDAPSFTPAGVGTYGRFLQVRVFDLWVHARDVAIPLGERPPEPSGFAAEAALREVDDSIGYIVGKRIGLPDGKSIVFHVGGGVQRDIAVSVDGRAARVDALDSPDVEVTADVETFVMLAAGRIDPQAQIDAGRITWSGDPHWGETAARNLAYTR
jgi:uncharacterized protein (TIGR03083 family)